MKTEQKHPGVPASLYLDQDESGNPRIVAIANELPRVVDPTARHVRRELEAL
jgi:hypothetical protein